jgi:hypothetical protein
MGWTAREKDGQQKDISVRENQVLGRVWRSIDVPGDK